MALYGLFFLIEPARGFFELAPLSWSDVALLALLALAWALLVMLFWRVRLVDRLRITWHSIRR